MKEYQSIPVSEAKTIAIKFDKDIVIILAWNEDHQRFHTVTYGTTPTAKVKAAQLGEEITHSVGGDLDDAEYSEDFRRDYKAARERAMAEAIDKHLPALKEMARQIIHPRDNTFSRMVRDFELAKAQAGV